MKSILKKFIGFSVFLAVLILVALAGWKFAGNRIELAEREKRAELKEKAKIAANLINPNLATLLTFTEADLGTFHFETIVEQLKNYKEGSSLRGIYTLVLKNQNLFFGPESYLEDDPMASPVGTKYLEPPQEFFEAFEKAEPYVFGPYSDEYGNFISALAPVQDFSGEVIILVGLDVLAKEWHQNILSYLNVPVLVFIGLAFVFILGIFATSQYTKHIRLKRYRFKKRIIFPVLIAILFLIGIFSFHEYYQGLSLIKAKGTNINKLAQNRWRELIKKEAYNLGRQAKMVSQQEDFLAPWQKKDLDSLYDLSFPLYRRLKEEFKITHFYFFDTERTCLLRVNSRERRGDIIERQTARWAQHTQKDAWGLEMGPLGTFTLRYVVPWKQKGELLGYLELGMEVEHLKNQLAAFLGIDVITLVRKQFTVKENFETGKEVFNFRGNWDDFADFLVLKQGEVNFDFIVENIINEKDISLEESIIFKEKENGRSFLVSIIPVYDTLAKRTSELVLIQNITANLAVIRSEIVFNVSVALAVLAGILVLLWFMLGKAEIKLKRNFTDLEKSQSLLTAATKGTGIGIWDYYINQDRLEWDDTMFKLYGVDKKNFRHKFEDFRRCILPEARVKVEKEFQESLAGKKEFKIEFPVLKSDGSIAYIAGACYVLRDKQNKPIRAIGVNYDVTKKKEEEKRLLQLSLAVEQSPAAIVVTDTKARITYVNPKFSELTGYSYKEAAGQNPRILKSGIHSFEHYKELWQTITAGENWRGEFHNKRKNGQLYWESAFIGPIKNKKGEITGFIGIKENITEFKQNQKKLEQLAIQYKTLVENVPGVVYRCANDKNWTMFFISDEIKRLTGYPISDFINNSVRTYASIILADDLDKVSWEIKKVLSKNRDYAIEYRIKRADNSIIWVQEKGRGVCDSEGRVLWLDGVIVDITSIKEAEELLEESQRRYEQLARQSRTFNWEADLNGLYTYLDPAVKEVLGYEPDELINKKYFYDLCPEKECEKTKKAGLAIIRKKESLTNWENQIETKKGRVLWVVSSGFPLFNKQGQYIGFRGADTDITERKKGEEEIMRAMQMQSEFTSTVSHELRTPLTAIKEGIAIVLDKSAGEINSEQEDFLSTAKRNVDRLARLINNVLDFQKLKAGKVEFEKELSDINKTVEEAYSQMLSEAKKQGLEFNLELDRSIPQISFDKDSIIRVIINLVKNAFKFTEKGAVTIFTGQNQAENSVYVKVKDTGCGIKESDLPKLFEDFKQLEKMKERKTGGTGLGLAISRKIINQHGGKIWAESKVGQGTTFIFILPIKERRELNG